MEDDLGTLWRGRSCPVTISPLSSFRLSPAASQHHAHRCRLVFVCSHLFSSQFPPPSFPPLPVLQNQVMAHVLQEAFFHYFKLQRSSPSLSPLSSKSVSHSLSLDYSVPCVFFKPKCTKFPLRMSLNSSVFTMVTSSLLDTHTTRVRTCVF